MSESDDEDVTKNERPTAAADPPAETTHVDLEADSGELAGVGGAPALTVETPAPDLTSSPVDLRVALDQAVAATPGPPAGDEVAARASGSAETENAARASGSAETETEVAAAAGEDAPVDPICSATCSNQRCTLPAGHDADPPPPTAHLDEFGESLHVSPHVRWAVDHQGALKRTAERVRKALEGEE